VFYRHLYVTKDCHAVSGILEHCLWSRPDTSQSWSLFLYDRRMNVDTNYFNSPPGRAVD